MRGGARIQHRASREGKHCMTNGIRRGAQLHRFWLPATMIATALVVVGVFVTLHGAGSSVVGSASASPTPALQGGSDMRGRPASPFTLRDQDGNMVSLQSLH